MRIINVLEELPLCPSCGIYFEGAQCDECGYYPLPEKNFNKRQEG